MNDDLGFLRNHFRNHCRRKEKYSSWEAAEYAIQQLRKKRTYKPKRWPLLAYQCLYCKAWHYGHGGPRVEYLSTKAKALLDQGLWLQEFWSGRHRPGSRRHRRAA